jgi:hypothetical protein
VCDCFGEFCRNDVRGFARKCSGDFLPPSLLPPSVLVQQAQAQVAQMQAAWPQLPQMPANPFAFG